MGEANRLRTLRTPTNTTAVSSDDAATRDHEGPDRGVEHEERNSDGRSRTGERSSRSTCQSSPADGRRRLRLISPCWRFASTRRRFAAREGAVATRFGFDMQPVGQLRAQPLEGELAILVLRTPFRRDDTRRRGRAARATGPAGAARATATPRCRRAPRPWCSRCWHAGRPARPTRVNRHSSSESGITHVRVTRSIPSGSTSTGD